ncbi:MAG: ATP-binding cassette domain-containing protein [Planctomycetota bacterium]|nr:ATP-binding cassette domain-containing protein [Planctomycetota bacterium]
MKREPIVTVSSAPSRSLVRALVSLGLGVRVGPTPAPAPLALADILAHARAGKVVLIVGPSGSGKSTLLRAVREGLGACTVPAPPRGRARVWDLARRHAGEACAGPMLATVGLAEASLLARRVSELSEGQRFRAGLLVALCAAAGPMGASGPIVAPGPIVADEFGAVLDAPTARALAHTFARACRRAGRGLVVATPRDDLMAPLAPELAVNLEAISIWT